MASADSIRVAQPIRLQHLHKYTSRILLMLTRCIYMTKAERSVSGQGHLQPRCHSKARSPIRKLSYGLLALSFLSPGQTVMIVDDS